MALLKELKGYGEGKKNIEKDVTANQVSTDILNCKAAS